MTHFVSVAQIHPFKNNNLHLSFPIDMPVFKLGPGTERNKKSAQIQERILNFFSSIPLTLGAKYKFKDL